MAPAGRAARGRQARRLSRVGRRRLRDRPILHDRRWSGDELGTGSLREASGCGGRIRTCDLQVMSLTSYRAAPPRVLAPLAGLRLAGRVRASRVVVASCFRDGRLSPPPWPLSGRPGRPSDPAATRSPAPWGAVPWARRGFTAEF